tara:strand:- start:487 stop:774 length:288 start_codon:yes stop_codon:yes gene_type:complete
MQKELKGTEDLKDSLPYGCLKKITSSFGYVSPAGVSEVISGKRNGNQLLIVCATEILAAYKNSGFEERLKEILKKYEKTNEARVRNRRNGSKGVL